MKNALAHSVLAGVTIAGLGAIIETAWLMIFHRLSFGVYNEASLFIQSFAAYILFGIIVGAAIGLLARLTGRVVETKPTVPQHFINTTAVFLGMSAALGFAMAMFGDTLPEDVEPGSIIGMVTVLGALVVGLVAFVIGRWIQFRLFGSLIASLIQKPARVLALFTTLAVVILGLAALHHFRTAPIRAAVTTLPSPPGNDSAKHPEDKRWQQPENESNTRPNVILVTLDTVRAMNLELYGYDRKTAPNLTEFASTAVLYENAYSQAPWTLPSHASLFTGRYPSELSENWGASRLREGHLTLAEILHAIRYRTGGFVGGVWCTRRFGLAQGFDVYEDHLPTRSTPVLSRIVNRLISNFFSQSGKRRADQSNEFVFRWLDTNASDPFFLFINYFDAHAPTNPVLPYRNSFEGIFNPVKSFFKQQNAMQTAVTNGTRDIVGAEKAHWITLYDSEIHFLDHQLARLFDKLKELDVYDNSLIIITSDHGQSYGEHHLAGHGGWLFEECMKVPLVIRYPGGTNGGTKVTRRFGLVELFPLILGELGIDTPESERVTRLIDSQKLCIMESGRERPHNRMKTIYEDHDLRALYRGPYKIVAFDDEITEIYNLVRDPGEEQNLIKSNLRVAAELDSLLAEILKGFRPPPPPTEADMESEQTDEELIKQLKSVGYL